MKLDLDAIERAAREATPGPWEIGHACAPQASVNAPSQYVCSTLHGNDEANAAHIAAMDPATVLLMCKAIRAAKNVHNQFLGASLVMQGESLTALREALAPFDAQPDASTTEAKI